MKDGAVCPVEYKSGVRHGIAADMQVCAQALCLEEMLGVRYSTRFRMVRWTEASRIRIEFTQDLRDHVVTAINTIRSQLLAGELPPAVDDSRCEACQLNEHCLPSLTQAPDKVNRYVRNVVFGCAT